MWDRWQRGETLHAIAQLFDRGHSSIQAILAATGGIRPPEHRRSRGKPKISGPLTVLGISVVESYYLASIAAGIARDSFRPVNHAA